METIKLEGILKSPNYGRVGVKVTISDNLAAAQFSNPKLGKDQCSNEKKAGNTNISFDERRGWLVEKFPSLTKEQIAKKLMSELNLRVKP